MVEWVSRVGLVLLSSPSCEMMVGRLVLSERHYHPHCRRLPLSCPASPVPCGKQIWPAGHIAIVFIKNLQESRHIKNKQQEPRQIKLDFIWDMFLLHYFAGIFISVLWQIVYGDITNLGFSSYKRYLSYLANKRAVREMHFAFFLYPMKIHWARGFVQFSCGTKSSSDSFWHSPNLQGPVPHICRALTCV